MGPCRDCRFRIKELKILLSVLGERKARIGV